MKEFETPVTDECIKVSVCRYQELLDAETRLDAIVDYIKSKLGKYTSDAEKDVLIIAGYAAYLKAFYEANKEQ